MIGIRALLINIANIFLGLVLFFLGLRIIFRLLAANALTPFVSWIYSVSDYLMTPFRGIFPWQAAPGAPGVLDWPAIVATIIYSLLVYLFITIIDSANDYYHHHEVTHTH